MAAAKESPFSQNIGHFEGFGLVRCQRIIKKGAPFKVGLRRRLGTDGKEHPNGQQKVYWHGRASGKHLDYTAPVASRITIARLPPSAAIRVSIFVTAPPLNQPVHVFPETLATQLEL